MTSEQTSGTEAEAFDEGAIEEAAKAGRAAWMIDASPWEAAAEYARGEWIRVARAILATVAIYVISLRRTVAQAAAEIVTLREALAASRANAASYVSALSRTGDALGKIDGEIVEAAAHRVARTCDSLIRAQNAAVDEARALAATIAARDETIRLWREIVTERDAAISEAVAAVRACLERLHTPVKVATTKPPGCPRANCRVGDGGACAIGYTVTEACPVYHETEPVDAAPPTAPTDGVREQRKPAEDAGTSAQPLYADRLPTADEHAAWKSAQTAATAAPDPDADVIAHREAIGPAKWESARDMAVRLYAVYLPSRPRNAAETAIRARDEQAAAWCERKAEEAQRKAVAHDTQLGYLERAGDVDGANTKTGRIRYCEGQAAAFRTLARTLRGAE